MTTGFVWPICSRMRFGHNELVILTGGLGPTEDDITRDSVAAVLGRSQYLSPEVVSSNRGPVQTAGPPYG